MDRTGTTIIPVDYNATPTGADDRAKIGLATCPADAVANLEKSGLCRSFPPLMQAIGYVGAGRSKFHSFVSRSCRLLWSVRHLHNRPLVGASGPVFVALASVEHAEPTVFATRRPDVSGSFGVRIF